MVTTLRAEFCVRVFAVLASLPLASCGGGEGLRWASAQNKTVPVEGIPYTVSWVQDSTGIDMRGVRAQFIVVLPDTMMERRRNTDAALTVAKELCGGEATVVSESRDGDMFSTRTSCGQPPSGQRTLR
jgi:hypothetical protein